MINVKNSEITMNYFSQKIAVNNAVTNYHSFGLSSSAIVVLSCLILHSSDGFTVAFTIVLLSLSFLLSLLLLVLLLFIAAKVTSEIGFTNFRNQCSVIHICPVWICSLQFQYVLSILFFSSSNASLKNF